MPLISVAKLLSVIVHLSQINDSFLHWIDGFQHFQAGWNMLFLLQFKEALKSPCRRRAAPEPYQVQAALKSLPLW
jgi:hypothetical protein